MGPAAVCGSVGRLTRRRGQFSLVRSVCREAGRRYRHGVDRRFLRPGWIAGHVLVFLACLTCLRLGWWQWERTQETTGTAQNFGYALLWPAFGAAFIYMWVRFLRLEVLKDAEDDDEAERDLRALLDDEAVFDQDSGQRASAADEAHSPATGHADPGDEPTDGAGNESVSQADDSPDQAPVRRSRRHDRRRPTQSVTISVAMVGEDDEDDPELTAYNQALAALAEEDRRRAR